MRLRAVAERVSRIVAIGHTGIAAEYEFRAKHGFEVAWQWHHLQRDCRYAGARLVDGPANPDAAVFAFDR